MGKRLTVVLGVLVIGLIAGCSSVGGDGVGTADPSDAIDGEDGNDGDGTGGDDADAGDSGTPSSTDGTPLADGNDGSASDDWERSDARTAIESAGSYTSTWTWRSSLENAESGAMTFTNRVDVDNERAHTTMRIDDPEGTLMDNFYADGNQYTRFASEGGSDATYVQSERPFDTASLGTDYGYFYDSGEFDDWSLQGTDTYDGIPVRRYVYDAPDHWLQTGQDADAEFEVTSARFELLVDADGIPRHQTYEVEGVDGDGNQQWFEWEFTVSDVGSTTVADPDWLGAARSGSR